MKTRLTLSVLTLASLSISVNADIREIPSEELTESYIENTTVIVRKQEKAETANEAKRVIKVSPLEDDFSEGEDLATRTKQPLDTLPANDEYLGERQSNALANQAIYNFQSPTLDPLQASRNEALQAASIELQALTGETIDLANPTFPTQIPESIVPPIGTGISSSPGSFVFSIPNSNGYPSDNFSTPGGEYQINITPDTIDFQLNVPQQ